MSNDLNQCNFIGRLGKDPEIKYMQNGTAVANLSIACGKSWKDKDSGQKQEKTEWINIVAFNKLAEIIGEYLKKGSQVFISGEMRTRKWQDKSGNDRYTTEIVASNMQMLGSSGEAVSQASDEGGHPSPQPAQNEGSFDDDIPF